MATLAFQNAGTLQAGISLLQPHRPETNVGSRIAGVATTAGMAVYEDPTTGKLLQADASSAGKQQCSGLVLEAKGIGQACTVVWDGPVDGFDLSGSNFGDLIYLDVTGTLNTVANATKTVVVGRVVATGLVDQTGAIRKCLFLNRNWVANW